MTPQEKYEALWREVEDLQALLKLRLNERNQAFKELKAVSVLRGPAAAKSISFVPLRVAERFAAFLVRQPNGCLEYTGCRDKGGYGVLRVGCEMHKAQRVAWFLKHGALNAGENVLHRCDNRACCDEEHLFLGDAQTNFDDMMVKNRDGLRGDKNYQRQRPEEIRRGTEVGDAIFTDEVIVEIRETYAAGRLSQNELGHKYGVWQNHISKIVRGDLWPHVGGPIVRR